MNIHIGFNTNTNSYTASIATPDAYTYGATLNEHMCDTAYDKVYDRAGIVDLVVESAYPYGAWPGNYTGYAVDTNAGDILCIDCARHDLRLELTDETVNDLTDLPEWQYDSGDLGYEHAQYCAGCNEVIAEYCGEGEESYD